MAVPDYQSIMLPFLRYASDGKEHTFRETIEALAGEFGLTEEDRRQLLPSGRQATFDNRVGWARTYLKKAGLIESPMRGKYRITTRGLEALGEEPDHIDVRFLKRYPEFLEFQGKSRAPKGGGGSEVEDDRTPEEILEQSYQDLEGNLTEELLDRLQNASPSFLEKVVVELLVAMGYGGSRKDAGRAVGRSGDDGIDGVIKEDRLGLDAVYIQAKRWENTVGRPVIQAFAGSLEGQRARKGVFITTSSFSPEARDYVERIEKKIILIDGQELASLMIDHSVGVTPVETYTVKRVDADYFYEGE